MAVAGSATPVTVPIELEDAARAADLRRMKIAATGLFVFVAVVFLACRWASDDVPALEYVGAFSEAAMVGALADWFAVTALFRHPLGLPIPHTAIIPHRKDQIGASLGQFVETNFLTRELLEERLTSCPRGRAPRRVAGVPANAERAAAAMADAMRGVIDVMDDEAISGTVGTMVERRLRETSVAPIVGKAIDIGIDRGHHSRLLDSVLTGLAGFLDENRETFRDRLDEGVAVVGSRADRQPHLRQDLLRRAELPAATSAPIRRTRCGRRSIERIEAFADPAPRRSGADRQGRGGQGGAARPSRGAGVDRVAVGRAEGQR